MVALLIIDMQKGMFTRDTPRYDSENVINRINTLANEVRKKNGTVIFIQHDGNPGEEYEPGTDAWQLIPQLIREDPDKIIHKTACDAFYRTELHEFLDRNKITTLIITGCATDYCVDTTIKAGTSQDYLVIVAKDAHTTADRPSLTAEQVIRHYNWIWRNLIMPDQNIRVFLTKEVITMLEEDKI